MFSRGREREYWKRMGSSKDEDSKHIAQNLNLLLIVSKYVIANVDIFFRYKHIVLTFLSSQA